MIAGLLIIGYLRDLYGHHRPAFDLLHGESGAQRRLHLGGEAAQVLLQLTGVTYSHHLKASVLVQAEEQYSSARPVGEGG